MNVTYVCIINVCISIAMINDYKNVCSMYNAEKSISMWQHGLSFDLNGLSLTESELRSLLILHVNSSNVLPIVYPWCVKGISDRTRSKGMASDYLDTGGCVYPMLPSWHERTIVSMDHLRIGNLLANFVERATTAPRPFWPFLLHWRFFGFFEWQQSSCWTMLLLWQYKWIFDIWRSVCNVCRIEGMERILRLIFLFHEYLV